MNEGEIQALAEAGYFRNKFLHANIEATHISWVLVTEKFAFKIKKPVKLSFLDFSTLQKRKKFCYRELQLNRRFSNIYLNVEPVSYSSRGRWSIGENGTVVDYAVVMKKMMVTKRMDKLLVKGKVTARDIVRLAQTIATFHQNAEIKSPSFNLANARATFNDIHSISSLVKRFLGKEYALIIKKAIDSSNSFLKTHAFRLRERIELGFIRDVHGDLHSGNIFLYKDPVIFDCIEFNDSYRQIDIMNEIAFFCMDLEAFGRKHLSLIFQEEYARYLPCLLTREDRALFVYYKCLRANVRAKVHAINASQSQDLSDRKLHVNALRNYLQLIKSYSKQT